MLQYRPRWYQDEAHAAHFDYFATHKVGNPLFCMPTGTGKSYTIGRFTAEVVQRWPTQRVLSLAADSRLVEQNLSKLRDLWPGAPVGVFSAQLNQKNPNMPITYGTVQSVVNAIKDFGHQDLLQIDEAQLVSPDEQTSFRRVIDGLMDVNPKLRVMGYSATPFRVGQGMLTEGENALFTDIAYDITGRDAFNRLVDEAYLMPLRTPGVETIVDFGGVKIQGGELNQKQAQQVIDVTYITRAAVEESLWLARDRRKWLVFSQGIKHAENIAEMYRMHGEVAYAVHSKLDPNEFKRIMSAYRAGHIRILVNADMLTTGFDDPAIDCIVMLRGTTSPGLWVQMLGRGTRPYFAQGYDIQEYEQRILAILENGKFDCMVLDFANNIATLGPINDPIIPSRKKKGKAGTPPIKKCEKGKVIITDPDTQPCGDWNHAAARVCYNCNAEFIFETKIEAKAGTQQVVSRDEEPQIVPFNVDRVTYQKWRKAEGDSIHVMYYCGARRFAEWITFDNPKVSAIARRWWRRRFGLAADAECPPNNVDALKWIHLAREPVQINVHVNRTYPTITGYVFREELPDELYETV